MDSKIQILYVYKVDHDLGQNPNPFGDFCTLAYCKGLMRKSIQKYAAKQQRANPKLSVRDMGIWVIGIAGSRLGSERYGKLLYAMKVTEILTFEEYWNDSRFAYKTQVLSEHERVTIENGDDRKKNYAFWRNNKSRLVSGDNVFNKKDSATDYVLVSDVYIYHGNDCRNHDKIFINRFGFSPNDAVRGHRIFSDNRKVADRPLPPAIITYILDEFKNAKCLARPTFSAEGFDYLCSDGLPMLERKDGNENNPLPKRVRYC